MRKDKRKINISIYLLVLFALLIALIAVMQIEKCAENIEKKEKEEENKEKEIAQKKLRLEKFQKEKNAFEKNIDKHYEELEKLFENEKYQEVLDKSELFEKYENLDYKDVKNLEDKAYIQILEESAKQLPASRIKANLEIYEQLSKLDPSNKRYKNKLKHYQNKLNQVSQKKEDKKIEKELKSSSDLQLLSESWKHEHGYAIFYGEVKNMSGERLKNVEAVVTWYDDEQNIIATESALIEYNPIMPGQTSPFKVMATYNPAMSSAKVEFSILSGKKLNTYRK